MDKYPEYPETVGKEAVSNEGQTWKTISVRGVGFAPTKQEVLIEPVDPKEPDSE